MKIENVVINNWQAPGVEWWSGVESRPTEPLINATLTLNLSWEEYHTLLNKNEWLRAIQLDREMAEAFLAATIRRMNTKPIDAPATQPRLEPATKGGSV